MSDPRRLTVAPEAAGARLDRWVTDQLEDIARNKVRRAFDEGRLTINGLVPSKIGTKVQPGDVVVYVPPERTVEDAPVAEDLPLVIVYEDADLCVINKAAGMVVHPAPGHPGGTMVNALMHHLGDALSGGFEQGRPGIVHRIDRDTSGLLVVAKTDAVHAKLSTQFAAHTVHRRYRAVVYGTALADTGTIETKYNRHHADRKKMTGKANHGRRAVTHWTVLGRSEALMLVELALETGRT
ncbi:MAG: 23S rRNA pseudouridine1911/1915/1917 synthase, partial [Myxococcota bacterium]